MSKVRESGNIEPDENKSGKRSESRGLRLDTTGEFLSLDGRPHHAPQTIIERGMERYHCRIFIENAWLLYDNCKAIAEDERMFLAPVHIKNHLAYTGTSGFEDPTVGVYTAWWFNFPDCAVDNAGNLVWYIAGSPLTGSNACMSVTAEDESVKMAEGTPFMKVWRSFMKVNEYYADAKKNNSDVYTLEEVLIKLRGEKYKAYLDALRQEMIDLAMLYNNDPHWPEPGTKQRKLVKSVRRDQMQLKWKEIMAFYSIFSEKEVEIKRAKETGNMDNYRDLLHKLAEFGTDFVETTFGKNVNRICLNDVVKFAKYKKSVSND